MKPFQFKKIAAITVFTFVMFAVSIFYYFAYNEIQFQILTELNRREALERELSSLLDKLNKFSLDSRMNPKGRTEKDLSDIIKDARTLRNEIKKHISGSIYNPETLIFKSVSRLFPVDRSLAGKLDSLFIQEKAHLKNSAKLLADLEALKLKSEDAKRLNSYHSIVEYRSRIRATVDKLQELTLEWIINTKEIHKNLSGILHDFYNKNLFILLLLLLLNALMYGVMIFILLSIFTRPLMELNALSEKINSGEFSLRKFHIPNFKEKGFSNISMAFRTLLQHIEEVDRVKGSIMSQVTHDLKSPLATMKKSIDLLENESYGSLTREQKQVVDILRKGYEQMNHLVQNLLNAARMEYDVLSLKLERFDLLKATMEVFEEHRVPLLEKNIRIKYNFHQRQSLGMIGDEERIKDVIRNLLGNAIKFTPENGKIYVEVDLREGDVYIRIQDTGIGIPAREKDKIFEKMYRASNSRSISVKGTGMGLFIVKNIITMHKGEIFVKSQEGVGTTFEIYLPRILKKPGE